MHDRYIKRRRTIVKRKEYSPSMNGSRCRSSNLVGLIPFLDGNIKPGNTKPEFGFGQGKKGNETKIIVPMVPPVPDLEQKQESSVKLIGPSEQVLGTIPYSLATATLAAASVAHPKNYVSSTWQRDTVLPNTKSSPRILVLDNDETTGSYQIGSLLFSLYVQLCGTPPSVHYFVEEYLKKGGARPGCVELLRHAYRLLKLGNIDEIILFTAASNESGWVDFLRASLEELAGIPGGTISRIFCGEDCRTRDPVTGRPIKDLRIVTQNPSQVLIVDDKPNFIKNGRVIPVREYCQHVPIDHLVDKIPCSPAGHAYARQVLRHDRSQFRPSNIDYSHDRDLFSVIKAVDDFFGTTKKQISS